MPRKPDTSATQLPNLSRRRATQLAAGSLLLPWAVAQAAPSPIRLGYVKAWPESDIPSNLVAAYVRQRFGIPVELVSSDPGPMWEAVASGHTDLTLTVWLPGTSEVYYHKLRNKLVHLGAYYQGTRLGLTVPDYVPVKTIAQLQSHHAQFHDKIYGVESGSVVNMMANKAIKTYHLAPMELVSSSTAAMTVQLKRAIARKDWIVVTGWQPLWIWADFKLHFLDDPEGVFGGVGHMDTVINPRLQRRAPQVVDWLRTFHLPQAELASMLLQLSNGQSAEQIAEQWLARQPESRAA